MYLKTLTVKNFRNYEDETFSFSNGVNILVGQNAQGKTNAVEAVFLLCTGYSPKSAKHKELIRQGAEKAEIFAEGETDIGKVTVFAEFYLSGEKVVKINGAKINKMADIFGNINSVFFNPAELKLVQESPEDRRRFMNISLSQISKKYFTALVKYNKILEQRNNLLKNPDKNMIFDTLPVWDLSLAKEAGVIYEKRNELIEKLKPFAKSSCEFLTNNLETLDISLEHTLKGTAQEIADLAYINLRENIERDLKLGFTTFGPHRQDIKLVLNGMDVKHYGSQGQQRTVALALKLAEAEIFKKETGEYPVLILDDVFSELDKTRQKLLVKMASKMQTILTTTHYAPSQFKDFSVNKITVENGKIKCPRTKMSVNGSVKCDQK